MNTHGQLGDGTLAARSQPADVVELGAKPTPTPTPTPAPTPVPVGGVAELPEAARSQPHQQEATVTSAPRTISLFGIAGALLLVTAAWYANRRRVR